MGEIDDWPEFSYGTSYFQNDTKIELTTPSLIDSYKSITLKKDDISLKGGMSSASVEQNFDDMNVKFTFIRSTDTSYYFLPDSIGQVGQIMTVGNNNKLGWVNQNIQFVAPYTYILNSSLGQSAFYLYDDGISKNYYLPSNSGYFALSVNGIFSDEDGNIRLVQEITIDELESYLSTSQLIPYMTYYITDLNMFYDAVSNHDLKNVGNRIMRCPKYYDISVHSSNNWKGIYNNSISYSINDIVIWGAKCWRNVSGNVGASTSDTILDNSWQIITTLNDTFYENKMYSIIYDFKENFITEQWDDRGNHVYSDRVFSSSPITDSDRVFSSSPITDLVSRFLANEASYTDWNNPTIFNNNSYGIFNNITPNIYNNDVQGYISNNKVILGIYKNTCEQIYQNNITQSISYNNIKGIIYNNTNNGHISSNILSGSISDNTNNGYIIGNLNNGDITNNSNNGNIFKNINNGNISNCQSSLPCDIKYNTNNGYIDGVYSSDVTDTQINK